MSNVRDATRRPDPAGPDRRTVIGGLAAAAAALRAAPGAAATPTPGDFDAATALAMERAAAAHAPSRMTLPAPFSGLDYDAYRSLRPRPDARLWRGGAFEADLLPPGFLFADAVALAEVADGAARPLPFAPDALSFDPPAFGPDAGERARAAAGALGWTGFRLHHRLNAPDRMDEVAVFQGATYFRAVARGLAYGLSARALALGTGATDGEEFPAFVAFWLHRPEPGAARVTLVGLLDSPSCAGAVEFVVAPGAETAMDVRLALVPRLPLAAAGIAPLTSMYWFGDVERGRVDDWRPAVHDSDGLAILTGGGERLWRPLANPRAVQTSMFLDRGPQGFGLAQRRRSFGEFLDAEADYHRRPSAWVAPRGDWGEGAVALVEIPTASEFNDNVVAFWRPAAPLEPGRVHRFDYRLTWSETADAAGALARVVGTRAGRDVNRPELRRFVIDFAAAGALAEPPAVEAEAGSGAIEEARAFTLPTPGGLRASFLFAPPADGTAELRLRLRDAAGAAASETWLYRWSAP